MRTESPFFAWRRLKFAKIIMWIKQLQFVPLDPSVRSKCRSACLPTTPTVAVSKVGQLTFDDILDRSAETTSFVHDALQRLVWISNIEDCAKGGSGSILAIRQTRFGPWRTSGFGTTRTPALRRFTAYVDSIADIAPARRPGDGELDLSRQLVSPRRSPAPRPPPAPPRPGRAADGPGPARPTG